MLCKDVMYEIEKEYPLNYALSWDNVGLLVGREEKEIKKIFTALSVMTMPLCMMPHYS